MGSWQGGGWVNREKVMPGPVRLVVGDVSMQGHSTVSLKRLPEMYADSNY